MVKMKNVRGCYSFVFIILIFWSEMIPTTAKQDEDEDNKGFFSKDNVAREYEKTGMMKNISPKVTIAACLVVMGLVLRPAAGHKEDMKSKIEQKCPERNLNYNPGSLRDAKRYLRLHNCRYRYWLYYSQSEAFKYQTDLTAKNRRSLLKMEEEISEFKKETSKRANEFNWKDFENKNNTIYRWFRKLSELESSAFPPEKSKELTKIKSDMSLEYSKAKICSYRSKKKCNLGLETDLKKMLFTSRNYDELKYIWKEWRRAINRKLKNMYLRYVQLSNEMARCAGFKDYGDKLRAQESVKGMEDDIAKLLDQIKPLYKQLHAYTRRKLIQQYGSKYIKPDGPIPAHILGHMFSQQWGQIFDILKPFPKSASPDVSEELQRRKTKPIEMFEIAEEFFTSLGFHKMTKLFWNNSVIEKPKNKEMVCHASAWNFYDGKDFRIKMCTQVNMGEFVTVHHEMGHVQYYQEYSHLPVVFQQGANSGFHEAVGDTVALSVSTPTHLKKIKLLKNFPNDTNSDITFLLKAALEKVVFLPSSYIYDVWRWKIFSGEIPQKEMNTHWWKMRGEYEGLCPPVRRTDDDLDPLSKYHVATDTAYIRYFVGHLLQFQFHKALCKESGHRGPLHTCDIYQSKKAGKLFRSNLLTMDLLGLFFSMTPGGKIVLAIMALICFLVIIMCRCMSGETILFRDHLIFRTLMDHLCNRRSEAVHELADVESQPVGPEAVAEGGAMSNGVELSAVVVLGEPQLLTRSTSAPSLLTY